MPNKSSTPRTGNRKPADNSNEALALHLAEAIRILRSRDDLPASLYNSLTDAVNDFQNELPRGGKFQESEPHILLMLDYFTKGGE